MARKMYTSYRLLLTDDHTLRFPAAGVTYIPIPAGSGADYAGLLSVDFPMGVKREQKYSVVVRQVTGSFRPVVEKPGIPGETTAAAARPASWRRIIGSFQVTVPVQVKEELLVPEQRLLSILRWIQTSIPAESRWSPVFRRHLVQVARRVEALGGDAAKVEASPTGDWQGIVAQRCRKWGWFNAVLLAGTVAAIGIRDLQSGLGLGAVFILSTAGWLLRCRQNVCNVLTIMIAGAGLGAFILAVSALSGNVSYQLFVALTGSIILAGAVWIYRQFIRCQGSDY